MLKWPDRAKPAIRSLFASLQDVEVYVEDTNDEVFYRALLQRATGKHVRIARVFGLGGREAVINAATKYDHASKPALFIIDGDLDWVRGTPPPISARWFHRHSAYCVENILICPLSIASLVSEELVLSFEDAEKRIGFEAWVNSIEKPLSDLFSAYATANEFCPHLTTVSTGVGVMCTPNRSKTPPVLDPIKVDTEKQQLLASVENIVAKPSILEYCNNVQMRISNLPFPLDAVSGKDFLLPLLHFHLQSLGIRIKKDSLRLRLAKMCAQEKLNDLEEAIRTSSQ